MKCLSIKQPWANMIVDGQKTIELRSWSTPYRGQLLIHSSKRPNIEPAGCILAVCDLVDCRPMVPGDEEASGGCPWQPETWSWVLRDVQRIDPPIPARGRLGLWEYDLEEPTRLQDPGPLFAWRGES
jgi:hypothetical protein